MLVKERITELENWEIKVKEKVILSSNEMTTIDAVQLHKIMNSEIKSENTNIVLHLD